MTARRTLLALVSGVLALVLLFGWWRGRSPQEQGETVPTWTPSTTSATPTPAPSRSASPSPSAAQLPAGCDPVARPIVPVRIRIDAPSVDSPVLSLGLADDGTVATPPFSQPRTVGWWNGGPRPGSGKGKVVLTAHTFHAGGALGNQLFDATSGLKPGTLIRLTDAAGHTQCYRSTDAVKVWVKDYDPKSDVIYDFTGAPQLALVICWDYQASSKFWASRVVFHATPLAR